MQDTKAMDVTISVRRIARTGIEMLVSAHGENSVGANFFRNCAGTLMVFFNV